MDGLVTPDQADALKEASRDWPSWTLTPRQICDLELLLNGGFSPLDGFMKQADYDGVVEKMRLASGVLWPMPITLDVPEEVAEKLEAGGSLVLRDIEGVMLAALEVEDVYRPDRTKEAEKVFGTTNVEHPGVKHLLEATNPVYVGGRLRGIQLPLHYDFKERRNTPRELRKRMELNGWS
ncbi:MAG: adenylyltransferase, partial [Deltaproteobacteria bacterium]